MREEPGMAEPLKIKHLQVRLRTHHNERNNTYILHVSGRDGVVPRLQGGP